MAPTVLVIAEVAVLNCVGGKIGGDVFFSKVGGGGEESEYICEDSFHNTFRIQINE